MSEWRADDYLAMLSQAQLPRPLGGVLLDYVRPHRTFEINAGVGVLLLGTDVSARLSLRAPYPMNGSIGLWAPWSIRTDLRMGIKDTAPIILSGVVTMRPSLRAWMSGGFSLSLLAEAVARPKTRDAMLFAIRENTSVVESMIATVKRQMAEMQDLQDLQVLMAPIMETDQPRGKRPQDYLADWDDEDTAEQSNDQNHDQRREALIAPLGLALVGRLSMLADRAATTDHGHAALADQITPTMQRLYRQAFERGAQSYTPGYRLDRNDEERILRLVADQHSYLGRLARDIAHGDLSDQQIAYRVSLYGNGPVRQVFNVGRHEAMKDAGVQRYEWAGFDDDGTCDLCEPRIGQVYTDETLPGEPGSGNFGDLCLGVCRCWLEPVEGEHD